MKCHLPQTLFACLGVLWLSVWGMAAQAQTQETHPVPATQPAINTTQRTHKYAPNTTLAQYTLSETYTQSHPVNLSLSGLCLVADSGSLMHDVTFSASTLTRSEAQPLASNMLSVTAGSHAYRLLPHGEHFHADQPAHIELAYEPLSVPHGFKPQDIHTYYFDEQTRQWKQLRRVVIDTVRHVVISETTHFTDFVNAVIRTPDMPEVSAFVPTTLADMEEPHPLSRVPMITVPEANAYGTASITYPIDIPAGRNGLQPDLTLSYSSDRGNGIMGVGWSFPQPAITIDTRWGVPQYDKDYETESYLLNGEQLIIDNYYNPDILLPYQMHKHIKREQRIATFAMRDTKRCESITRYGLNPHTYSWRVVSRDGTTYYYGDTSYDKDSPYTLCDAQRNVAYWALREVEDVHGNRIRYEYERSKDNELYLTGIYYNRNYSDKKEFSYRIRIRYKERDDVITDGRLGFIRKTDRLVCYIDIAYCDKEGTYIPTQRYQFSYDTDNGQSLLTGISLYRVPQGDELNRNLYGRTIDDCIALPEFFDDCRLSTTTLGYYGPKLSDMFSADEVLITDKNTGNDWNVLNRSSNIGWNAGGTLTLGFGKQTWQTNLSAGGNYNYSEGAGTTNYMLMDIDGDGLVDKVYSRGGVIYFRKQETDAKGNPYFATERSTGLRSSGLSLETSKTNSWGLQAGADPVASVSGGWSNTDTYTSCYFSDVNGDGLPDLVDNGVVHFNRLNAPTGDFTQYAGEKHVTIDSSKCRSYFYYDGTVALSDECYVDYILQDSFSVSIDDYYYPCEECEQHCYNYLYQKGDDYNLEGLYCQECMRSGCAERCKMDLTCREWDWYMGSPELQELCERYQNVCPECLHQLALYGFYSIEYQSCADAHCVFRGQRMVCEECREECLEDSILCESCIESSDCAHEWKEDPYWGNRLYIYGVPVCEACASECEEYGLDSEECYYCRLENCEDFARCDPNNGDYDYNCRDGVRVCEECSDICLGGCPQDECNECKRENRCNGYIPADIFEEYRGVIDNMMEQCYDRDFTIEMIDALRERGVICKACERTCRNDPSQCLPCLYRYCFYREEEDIIRDLIADRMPEYQSKYPQAYFRQEHNKVYIYDTVTVCPQENNIDPDLEIVRVWVAPHDGQVTLSNTVQLLQDTSMQRQQTRNADGVRYVIQHEHNVSTTSATDTLGLKAQDSHTLRAINIRPDDYSAHSNTFKNISVSKGDIFFFHLISRRSHDFDNVDWRQTFTYAGETKAYSSEADFICSDEQTFQTDTAGTVTIDLFVTNTSGQTIKVTIDKQQTDGPTSATSVSFSHKAQLQQVTLPPFPDCSPETTISLRLMSSNQHTDWGKVEVRARLSFSCSSRETFVTWLAPKVDFAREVSLRTIYYKLFGPLYKGWGQFTFNNKYATELIPLDSLRNMAWEQSLEVSAQDSAAFCNSITFSDTAAIQTPDALGTAFNQRNIYNPLSNTWVEMSVDAQHYRWEAYGNVARNGRTLMSNARDKQAAAARVQGGGSSGSSDSPTIETYDNDVPVARNGEWVTAVRKKSSSKQKHISYSLGIGTSGLGLGHAFSENTYRLNTDFMDMNGDRFPDIVRENSIQYTQPWGGLGGKKDMVAHLHTTVTKADGPAFSGSFPIISKVAGSNPKSDKFALSLAGSNGASATNGVSEATFALIDINGDGLPDKLTADGDSIRLYLNIGYGFVYYSALPRLPYIDRNANLCINGSVSFGNTFAGAAIVKRLLGNGSTAANTQSCKFQMSLSAGISGSISTNTGLARLIDMDGNGLLDLVDVYSGGIRVSPDIYQPNGYQSTRRVSTEEHLQNSTTQNAGLDLAVTAGFSIFFVKLCAGIHGSPVNISLTEGTFDIMDMNGDGLPDLVRADKYGIHVRYNQMGKNGLLKHIINPTGQQIELNYQLSAPTTQYPGRHWLLSEVRDIHAHAPMGDTVVAHRFVYADPYYNREERTSYGYGAVTTEDINTQADYAVYRRHVRRYNNRDFADHGRLEYEAILDAEDNIYTEYELGVSYTDMAGKATDDVCHDTKIRVSKETHYTRYYEGTSSPIVTAKQYNYDHYHNVVAYRNLGDTVLGEDDLTAEITYHTPERNLVSRPKTLKVYANGVLARQSETQYRLDKLTTLTLRAPATDSTIVTRYEYDATGLLTRVTMPTNHKGQKATLRIEYDSLTHSLPVRVTNQWGQTCSTLYHPYWQVPTCITDATGNSIHYTYDAYGRLTSVIAPNEAGKTNPTISYSYQPISNTSIWRYPHWNPTTPFYMDVCAYSSSDSTCHRSLYDARGNLCQRFDKRMDGYVLSNQMQRDCFGRNVATLQNILIHTDLPTSYYMSNAAIRIQTDYDVLDRPTMTHWADGAETSISYGIGVDALGVPRLLQNHTDENGNEWQQYTSPQGWLTTSIAPDEATTTFRYDPLGQLLQSTDPDGLTTTHTYDGFGRRTQRTHPDAGTTRWTYDAAGNMIASATQSQLDDNTATSYEYDYNRLDQVHYPQHPQVDVFYTYSDSTGRLLSRKDITGTERYEYDKMGNVSLSERLIVLPTEQNGYRFTTRYTYDSFGRMQYILLPDEYFVRYSYNYGKVSRIWGNKRNARSQYAKKIHYDAYDRIDTILYGNDIRTTYTYDTNRQWLTEQKVQGNEKVLQDLHYQYDHVGNITEIEQVADKPTWFGGPYIQTHQYDAQNRLIRADMLSDNIGLYSNYNLSYSPSGRIGNKTCDDMLWDYWYGYGKGSNGSLLNHTVRSIYDLYNDNTSFLQWDANGQLQAVVRPCTGDMRHHWWNEAGQMVASIDNASCGYYGYDGNGNRAYKLTGQSAQDQYNAGEWQYHVNFNDAVLYVNPYFIVTPKGYTRHYYNGSIHIASQIGRISDLPTSIIDTSAVARERIANAQAYMASMLGATEELIISTETIADIDGDELDELQWQCLDTNTIAFRITLHSDTNMLFPVLNRDAGFPANVLDIYYYHADHLGSASWITNKEGTPIEYIHYMPYGELWYDWQASSYNERFKFTGKERDTETGYDYFGARYYSSILGHWISVDKLADDYPHITPYAQSAWNPIKYVDTDGMDYTVAVDGDTKTITIQATYYTNSDDYESAKVAAEFWNENSGKYSYTEKKETYTINFDLKVEDSRDNLGADMSAQSDISGQANRYTVGDYGLKATENGATYNGNAVRVRNSRRLTDTGAHEIGHTLGLTHSDYGIMTPSSNDSHRGTNNMPEFIENIISNAIHPTNGQIGKATIISPHSLKGYGHVRKIK